MELKKERCYNEFELVDGYLVSGIILEITQNYFWIFLYVFEKNQQ